MRRTDMQCTTCSDKELLAILVGPKKAEALFKGSVIDLFTSAGDSKATHVRIAAARELVRRAFAEEMRGRDSLASPVAVRSYLRLTFLSYEHEAFVVVFLDAQNRVIAANEMFRGTLTQTSVYPREVVKAALRHNAAGVILAHNHPSGVAEPSMQDQALTRALAESLALVDVKVLDHFIVAGSQSVSFAERGLL